LAIAEVIRDAALGEFAFWSAEIKALRSAFPFAELRWPSAFFRRAMYLDIAAAAAFFDSVWSGARVLMALPAIGLITVQSAAGREPLGVPDAVVAAVDEDVFEGVLEGLFLSQAVVTRPAAASRTTSAEALGLDMNYLR
jgi:hypothetical protein